jgi:hypothetical protein
MRTGVLIKKKKFREKIHEVIVRRWPSVNQKQRPQEKPALPTP